MPTFPSNQAVRLPSYAVFVLAAFVGLLVAYGKSSPTSRLIIDDRALHAVQRDIFGQFLERASWNGELGPEAVCDDEGRLPAVVEVALADLQAPLVRFPFGTAGDYIDWQDLIDLPGRTTRPDSIDHSGNRVTNRFGYPEFFDLAKRLRWKTILVANLRDALHKKKPISEAAAHAAGLLKFALKHAAPGSISAFQIGNESWFFWPPKPEERDALGVADPAMAAAHLRECLIAYADAARLVDPKIALICDAPLPDDLGGLANESGRVWRMAVDHPDIRSRYQFLASHSYAPLGFKSAVRNGVEVDRSTVTEDEVWFGTLATLGRFDSEGQSIADSKAYDEISGMGYRVAVTEWNWNGWNLNKSFPQAGFRDGVPAALGAAGFLHGLLRHPNVAFANQSMMLGTRWGITSVRVLPDGSTITNPQAEPVRLYAGKHGGYLLASRLEGVPNISDLVAFSSNWPPVKSLALLDVVVTADPARLVVHLINRSRSGTRTLDIQLPPGQMPNGNCRVMTLTGDLAKVTTTGNGRMRLESRDLSFEGNAFPLELPPSSISVLEIPVNPAAWKWPNQASQE